MCLATLAPATSINHSPKTCTLRSPASTVRNLPAPCAGGFGLDGTRFDAWTRRRFGLMTGGAIASTLGLAGLLDADAKKKKNKNKNKKKKQNRCITVGNTQVLCPKGEVCCDPTRSTGPGCAPPDSPVCCLSTGFAHGADFVCCATSSEGTNGVCVTAHPHCCPPGIVGCCEAGFPVCCSSPLGPYCCPSGMTCCETDPSGCCAVGRSAPVRDSGEPTRGTWLPAVPTVANQVAISQAE